MLKVKVKVKGHVIRALSWILGMSYSVTDGLVLYFLPKHLGLSTVSIMESGDISDRVIGKRQLSKLHAQNVVASTTYPSNITDSTSCF